MDKANEFNERNHTNLAFEGLHDVISLLSHDVRNLAAGVMGVLELVSNGQLTPDSPEYPEFIQMGYENSLHLLATLANIVDLARLAAGTRELIVSGFDLYDCIACALDQVRALSEDRQITISATSHSMRVTGDQQLIQSALVALSRHVMRNTPQGSQLRLTLHEANLPDHAEAYVTIQNDAPAIIAGGGEWTPQSDALFPKLTSRQERFVTLDRLELGFCHQVAMAHRGRLTVRSEPAGGNTFSLILPADCCDSDELDHATAAR